MENGQVETYVNQTTVKNLDLDSQGVTVVIRSTNAWNAGTGEETLRIDKTGVVVNSTEPNNALGKEFIDQVLPYRTMQFPLVLGNSFVQINKKNLNSGHDFDRDGEDERVDIISVVTNVNKDAVTVPAGTYPEAFLTKTQTNLLVHLSSRDLTIPSKNTLMQWHVKGLGPVKSFSRFELLLEFVLLRPNQIREIHKELLGVRAN